MVTIKIDNTGDGTWWLYNNDSWKDYCGCENFDEEVVIKGNRDYKEIVEASWYKKATEMLEDLDCRYDRSDWLDAYKDDYSITQLKEIIELYDKCRCTDDIIINVLRILYPNDTFSKGTLSGYCQRDWQEYIVKGNVDTDMLENMYFGKIADVFVQNGDDEYGDIITHDELWKAESENLKQFLKERYDLSDVPDDEITIMKADGMKQVVDWKEVG